MGLFDLLRHRAGRLRGRSSGSFPGPGTAAGRATGPGRSAVVAPTGTVSSGAPEGTDPPDPGTSSWRVQQELQRIREEVVRGAPQGMTHDDGSRLDAFIDALGLPDFPATREQLIARARLRGAREAVVVDLRSLAFDGPYRSMPELMWALGIGRGGRVDVPGTVEADDSGR